MWGKVVVTVAALAVLSGCAGKTTQKQAAAAPEVEYTFNSPADTPREQWSTALLVTHELMGIAGLKDVVAPEPAADVAVTRNWNGVDSLATGALGVVSPTTHVSAGGGLAIGAGLFLLSGSNPGPMRALQVAFWVPAELAANADEANQVAAQTWADAKTQVTGRNQRVDYVTTAAYPINHGKKHDSLKNIALRRPIPFEGAAKRMKVDGLAGEFYGPIFIDRNLGLLPRLSYRENSDGLLIIRKRADRLQEFADVLPAWASIYVPPLIAARMTSPATVVFNNQLHYFVAPAPGP